MKNSKLPKIIRGLLNSKIYPHPVKDIKFVQTQMSCVFLTGDFVYKIKKPVNFGFLDYTTLKERKKFCEREVALNRRLAPEVYVGVVPIHQYQGKILLQSRGPAFVPLSGTMAGKARLRPELVERLRRGKGEIVEYAVKMRQLPAEKMLSSLLRRDRITRSIIKKVAQKIADFHQKAETNKKIADYGSLKIIKKNCRENFEQTKKYIGITTSAKDFQEIKSWTEDFIIKNKELFEKRMKNGKIRDCHGDLQSDHICLQGRKIHIYDCIEFNERFRYGDVASEVAFLAMDFDFHGRPDLSDYLAESYARETADKDFLKLLKFYKCYRAYVLGKVRSFKLDDFHVPQKEKEKAKNLAKRYFKLAYSYICRKPTLIVICGLSGSGKTTTAVILAKKTGFQYISSDIVRKKLAKIPPFEHKYHEFGKGIYSPEFFQKTYEKMFGRAEGFLKNGKSVIIDATFKKREERKKVKNLAEKLGVKFLLIECRLSEKIIRKKMKERAKRKIVSDADWKIYQKQKKDFDKITEIPRQNHIIVDTSKPMKKITPVILKRIL